MKKLFIYSLFLSVLVFFFPSMASTDVIPPDSHPLDRCVKVVNLDEFPIVVLISYITGPMVEGYETYQIENNKCWGKGYKFNHLNIYWNTKDKPNAIDPDKLLLTDIESYGGYVDKSNPLIKEGIEYSITGFSGKKLVLYKSKQTSEYNNGAPKKVETFNNPLSQEIKNQNLVEQEKILVTKTDIGLAKRVSGNILLQVEKNGECWYVYPDNKKKYYLGQPADAFMIMGNLGLGIKHSKLNNYFEAKFPSRLSGKILLDVDQNGEAYYINPRDLKGYYLNKPADAFRIMRAFSLGITNSDIRKIDVGEIK